MFEQPVFAQTVIRLEVLHRPIESAALTGKFRRRGRGDT